LGGNPKRGDTNHEKNNGLDLCASRNPEGETRQAYNRKSPQSVPNEKKNRKESALLIGRGYSLVSIKGEENMKYPRTFNGVLEEES